MHGVGIRSRRTEDVFQDRQFAEERDADGLLHIGGALPAGEKLFLAERKRNGPGDTRAFGDFRAHVVALDHVRAFEFEIERHAAVFAGAGDGRLGNVHHKKGVAADVHAGTVVFVLQDVLIFGREAGLELGVRVVGDRDSRGAVDGRASVLLKQADETEIERGGGVEAAESVGERAEKIGSGLREAGQNRFRCLDAQHIVCGVEEVKPGAVLPRQVVHADVQQIAFADFIHLQFDARLRDLLIQPFEFGLDVLHARRGILEVEHPGLRVEFHDGVQRTAGNAGLLDHFEHALGGTELRLVGAVGDAGAGNDRVIVVHLAGTVQCLHDFLDERHHRNRGGHDHDLPVVRLVFHAGDAGRFVEPDGRALDERSQIGRLGVFEFERLTHHVVLGIVLQKRDVLHFFAGCFDFRDGQILADVTGVLLLFREHGEQKGRREQRGQAGFYLGTHLGGSPLV